MTFYVKFNTDGADFEDEPGEGIDYCLSQVLNRIRLGHQDGFVMDMNGNIVGTYGYDDKE